MDDDRGARALGWRLAGGVATVTVVTALLVAGRQLASGLDLAAWLTTARGLGARGALLLAACFVPASLLALPISPLAVAAGWLYGPVVGTLVACPATAIGALAPFLLGRKVLRGLARAALHRVPRAAALEGAIRRRGLRIALLLRLAPFMPFPVLNYAFGATAIRARDFFVGTMAGMLPLSVVFAAFGATLADAGSPVRAPRTSSALVLAAAVLVAAAALWAARRELARALREPEAGR